MCGCLGDVEDSLRIIEESPMLKNLGDQTGRQKVDNVKAVVGVVDVVKEVCQPSLTLILANLRKPIFV